MFLDKEQMRKIKKTVLIGGGALVGVASLIGTVTAIMWKRISRKMKENDGENNMVYISMLWKNNCTIGADTDNVYLSTACGALKATMPAVPDHDVNVDVYACLGRINLWVPLGVKVCCDLDLPCGGELCEELSEANERDDVPVVHVTGRVGCGKLNIRRIEE
jgi:hypothetical protein